MRSRAVWVRAMSVLLVGALTALRIPLASADTDVQFEVSGSFDLSSDVFSFNSGSMLTIDTTTGLATGAALSVSDGIGTVTYSGVPGTNTTTEYDWIPQTSSSPGYCVIGCLVRLENTAGTGFVGFTGGDITGGAFLAHPVIGEPDNAITAIHLTPTTSVPEPATLALFSLGLIGVRLFRRRPVRC